MTEESKVKKKVSTLLKKYAAYYEMPVPSGFGKSGLDYQGCFHGKYFAIETKAPGKRPTPRQEITIKAIEAAGGRVFVIDGDCSELQRWLEDH